MTLISITNLYEFLAAKLGRDTAQHLTGYIEEKISYEFAGKSQLLATKEDLAITKDQLTKEISRVDTKISDTKSELIKWMFVFWIAQLSSTFAFIVLFVKK